MKFLLVPVSLFLLIISKESCQKKKTEVLPSGCYKGKLEVKAACMNYTISIQSSGFDTNMVVSNWKDETTGKIYKNAFGLNSRCNFPTNINEGDEFYFTIDNTSVQNCAVCLIYYPTPEKKLSIKVLNGPCSQ